MPYLSSISTAQEVAAPSVVSPRPCSSVSDHLPLKEGSIGPAFPPRCPAEPLLARESPTRLRLVKALPRGRTLCVFCTPRPPLLRARNAATESEVTSPSQTSDQMASASSEAAVPRPLPHNPSSSAPANSAPREASSSRIACSNSVRCESSAGVWRTCAPAAKNLTHPSLAPMAPLPTQRISPLVTSSSSIEGS